LRNSKIEQSIESQTSFQEQLDILSNQFIAAYQRRDAISCSEAYTIDAEVISPGGKVTSGRDTIVAHFQSFLDSGYEIRGLTTVRSASDGNVGYATQIVHGSTGDGAGGRYPKLGKDIWWCSR
jgi:ketosteroid isomerase-like protein